MCDFHLIFCDACFRLANQSLIDNGASLQNTTLVNLRHNASLMEEFSVRCIINVENWTAWKLKDALSHNHCGYIHEDFQAMNVDPGFREIMVGHKQVRFLIFGRVPILLEPISLD